MAAPAKKPGALVVDIDVGRPPKRKGGPAGPSERPASGGEGDDDVAGEMIAQRAIDAFKSGNAAALNTALKDHYEHCKASSDDGAEPAEGDDLGGLSGMGGPGSEY